MGAPISRTRAGRQRALGMLRWYAGMATSIHGETIPNSLPGEIFSYTLKEPVGVVGAIIPGNGPLSATIWKIGPGLATGRSEERRVGKEGGSTCRFWWSA